MRRTLALAFAVPFFGSIFACTAILGDFTVGTTTTDGGTDAPNDTGTDSGDATSDGPLPPAVLTCLLNGSPTTLGASATANERIAVHAMKNDRRRVMWTENSSTSIHFTTIDGSLKTASIVNQPADLMSGAMALVSYDGGFAAFGLDSSNAQIVGLHFDDDGAQPTVSLPVTAANGLPASFTDVSIAAAPLGNEKFFVVYTLSLDNKVSWSMYAGTVSLSTTGGPGTFKLVNDKITARPSLNSDALVIDTPDNRAILFVGADKGNGATTVYQLDLGSGGFISSSTLNPIHGNSTYEPSIAQTDIGLGVDKVGMAFLEYDLGNPSQPFYLYAAAFPVAGIGNFKPTLLPTPVEFKSTADISVDKGRSAWKHFLVGGSHLVQAARFTQTGNGVNFLWLDGQGRLRGKASGTTALVTNEKVAGAAGVMVDPPTAVLADAVIAWVTDSGDVRIANVGCAQ